MNKIIFRFLMAIAAIFAFASMAFGQTETSFRGFKNEATAKVINTVLTTVNKVPSELVVYSKSDSIELKGQVTVSNIALILLEGKEAFRETLTVADQVSGHDVYVTAFWFKPTIVQKAAYVGQSWDYLVIDKDPMGTDDVQTYKPNSGTKASATKSTR